LCLLDLCVLFMSLSKHRRESDQALYSPYLKLIIEKLVVYNDLDTIKSSIRKDLLDFFQIEIEQIKLDFSFEKNFM
jgi:hypothetical protein